MGAESRRATAKAAFEADQSAGKNRGEKPRRHHHVIFTHCSSPVIDTLPIGDSTADCTAA
jgi:hypothetical protein